jgi:squalene-hopene/tetraprenyl-beta-curcumene cyclase
LYLEAIAPVSAQVTDTSARPPSKAQIASMYATAKERGVDFLLHVGRKPNGSYSEVADPGITSLCVTALLRSGRTPTDPAVAKSLSYLTTFIRDDGGIYRTGSYYQNYETCISMLALQAANRDGRYDRVLKQAGAFVKSIQWDESEGLGPDDPQYGGAGYGKHKRPDLSNTQFLIEALRGQETDANQEAIQRALVFVSRTQNLESPHNQLPFPKKNPDGGFYYTPAAGGSSEAGKTPEGGLRSYGSMTYAGLKSLIYAGLTADDPRVQAALDWLQDNYSLRENPGIGDAGLFYYYHTFAKTLDAVGERIFVEANGTEHDWRAELIVELSKRQLASGAWTNQNVRWMEGDPNLVTAYALLALSYCEPAAAAR